EFPAGMEKPPTIKSIHRSRMTQRKEGENRASAISRDPDQRRAKSGHHTGAPSARKEKRQMEKPETNQEKGKEEKEEVMAKSTVVDIDRVRDNEVQEENMGLLEAAEQEDDALYVICILQLSVPDVQMNLSAQSCHFDSQVIREHERAVIFRLGHLLRGKPKGPGLLFYLPVLDICHIVDIRLRMLKVPPHVVVTKDLARPELSAVCYYQIENVALCSAALSSLTLVLQSLVQAAIRDVFAQYSFSHILRSRRRIGGQIKTALDSVTCRWGIKVERQVKASEGETAVWEGFRASLRHLQPALVLPLPPDLLNINPELTSLPPPPPPASDEDEGLMLAKPETDSPMI
uniref:NPHS2 stomatin family member, podocin n=1 Tax=Cyprinodon variegatus TaxID=28743 RepID=A0A3Q2D2U7_CYPVA